jgi:L-threonylcarbamoyladenylate synthase
MPIVPATTEAIDQAAEALRRGEIVAFPTETVYGLGANALDARAVAKIFAAKERPRFNPLIVHVPDLAAAERYAVMTGTARRLAEAFWPGPLSLVLKKRPGCGIADLVSAGLDTLALRAPAHPVARVLLAAAKLPIAAPSANRSGRVSPTTAEHVEAELGDLPTMILDGGPCPLGIESTVIGAIGDEAALLRPGAVPREAIELVLGRPLATVTPSERPASPGQLATHYAPEAKTQCDGRETRRGSACVRREHPCRRTPDHQSQFQRRSRRGGGRALRGASGTRPGRRGDYRRDADSRARPRRGDQRPLAARGQSGLALSHGIRAAA